MEEIVIGINEPKRIFQVFEAHAGLTTPHSPSWQQPETPDDPNTLYPPPARTKDDSEPDGSIPDDRGLRRLAGEAGWGRGITGGKAGWNGKVVRPGACERKAVKAAAPPRVSLSMPALHRSAQTEDTAAAQAGTAFLAFFAFY